MTAGYYALEVWGGAIDAAMRFLNEDPWERLRAIRENAKTKLQMLLRSKLIRYKTIQMMLLKICSEIN